MHSSPLALALLFAFGCTRSGPAPTPPIRTAPPVRAKPAAEAPASGALEAPAQPRPKGWVHSAGVREISVAVAADAQPESGPPPGDVRRGASVASLTSVFGADWPFGEHWSVDAREVVLGGRRFVRLMITAEAGEDVRQVQERVALLPAAGGLRPVWRGVGRVTQTEMDQCHSGTEFELAVEGGALVITRRAFAEYQPPSEDENSQTPDFDAIKATCKPAKTVVERVPLTR